MASLAIAHKILLSQQVCAEQKIGFHRTSQITAQRHSWQTTMLRAGCTVIATVLPTDCHAVLEAFLMPSAIDLLIACPVAVSAGAP